MPVKKNLGLVTGNNSSAEEKPHVALKTLGFREVRFVPFGRYGRMVKSCEVEKVTAERSFRESRYFPTTGNPTISVYGTHQQLSR